MVPILHSWEGRRRTRPLRPNRSVPRTHALLVRREDGWVLSDLGSHNGTRLNGWLVREPVQVRAGDRVEFGSMTFIIQDDVPAAPPPAGQEEAEGPGPADAGPDG